MSDIEVWWEAVSDARRLVRIEGDVLAVQDFNSAFNGLRDAILRGKEAPF